MKFPRFIEMTFPSEYSDEPDGWRIKRPKWRKKPTELRSVSGTSDYAVYDMSEKIVMLDPGTSSFTTLLMAAKGKAGQKVAWIEDELMPRFMSLHVDPDLWCIWAWTE